jgi:hypothetical protein
VHLTSSHQTHQRHQHPNQSLVQQIQNHVLPHLRPHLNPPASPISPRIRTTDRARELYIDRAHAINTQRHRLTPSLLTRLIKTLAADNERCTILSRPQARARHETERLKKLTRAQEQDASTRSPTPSYLPLPDATGERDAMSSLSGLAMAIQRPQRHTNCSENTRKNNY